MQRSLYDSDCSVWSPVGRIYQVEYAMEAVKQGTCVVGLRSKTHAVLVCFKRNLSDLSFPSNKLVTIDDHIGMTMSGLTADSRILTAFMQRECLNHKYVYESPYPLPRLVATVGEKAQLNIQRYGSRPFGVGLLLISYDENSGARLFETCPSGNYYEYHGMALGARSQSAKTYLEKKFETFDSLNLQQLVKCGLDALASTSTEPELNLNNIAVGVVGIDQPFIELTKEQIQEAMDLNSTEAMQIDG